MTHLEEVSDTKMCCDTLFEKHWSTNSPKMLTTAVVVAVATAVVANAIATNNFELVEKKISQQSLKRKISSLVAKKKFLFLRKLF